MKMADKIKALFPEGKAPVRLMTERLKGGRGLLYLESELFVFRSEVSYDVRRRQQGQGDGRRVTTVTFSQIT